MRRLIRLATLILAGAASGWMLAGKSSPKESTLIVVRGRDQALREVHLRPGTVSQREVELMSFPPQGEIRAHSHGQLLIFRWSRVREDPGVHHQPSPKGTGISPQSLAVSVEAF